MAVCLLEFLLREELLTEGIPGSVVAIYLPEYRQYKVIYYHLSKRFEFEIAEDYTDFDYCALVEGIRLAYVCG
jgi:hypothetical protein